MDKIRNLNKNHRECLSNYWIFLYSLKLEIKIIIIKVSFSNRSPGNVPTFIMHNHFKSNFELLESILLIF